MDAHPQRAQPEYGGGVRPVAVESHLLGEGDDALFPILPGLRDVLEVVGARFEPNLLAGPVERAGQGWRVLRRQDDPQLRIGSERRGPLR